MQFYPIKTCRFYAKRHKRINFDVRQFSATSTRKMSNGKTDRLIIGISGATCSGKTTLANALQKVFPNSLALNQDKFYWPEDSVKHKLAEGINHINWELVSAYDNDKLITEIMSHVAVNQASPRAHTDSALILSNFNGLMQEISGLTEDSNFSQEMEVNDDIIKQLQAILSSVPKVIFVDGILIFNHSKIINICDLKFFATLDYKTCLERRTFRSYDPPDVPGYFEKIVYPHYIKNMEDMKKLDRDNAICYLDGKDDMLTNFKIIVKQIIEHTKFML